MKRISKKMMKEFIEKISYVKETSFGEGDDMQSDCYYLKSDDGYITHVGLEGEIKWLLKRGITEHLQSINGGSMQLGFNPDEQKWYGWSHRALYGFTTGSECKKGSCHYQADNKENFAEACLGFWQGDEYSVGDDKYEFTKGSDYYGDELVDGVLVTYTYNDKVPNEKLRGSKSENFSPFPDKWGKGEWVATNMVEAKEMACDFAKGVS